jgi:hypothetical protein
MWANRLLSRLSRPLDASQEEVHRSEDGRFYRFPLGTPVDDLELRQQFRPALVELLDRHESGAQIVALNCYPFVPINLLLT